MFKRYGMNIHVIKKVKQMINNDHTDTEIQKELDLKVGQVDFVRNILCNGYNRHQDRRIGSLESKVEGLLAFQVGSQVFNKDIDFGVGTVVEVFKKEFDYMTFMTKFTSRQFPTLCNMSKDGILTTSPDGKVRTLKRLS